MDGLLPRRIGVAPRLGSALPGGGGVAEWGVNIRVFGVVLRDGRCRPIGMETSVAECLFVESVVCIEMM